MKKTLITLLLAVALLASALGAAAFAEENVHLVFWHGMSGTNGEIIDYISSEPSTNPTPALKLRPSIRAATRNPSTN